MVITRGVWNFDHKMLIVDVEAQGRSDRIKRKFQFRFEVRWLQSEGCKRVIDVVWTGAVDGDAHVRPWKKIQACRIGLIQWNQDEFEQPRQEVKTVR
ncbi:UNVERIFIED_CONTAM: hypothetical protein Scaly_2671800 [Sesamum calycinum]|uniref:Uncharacterized protein n=1 Tax=Sesamum calycinum TaxID=2727403 RepID=A0AAW2J6T5_9LAMI